MLQPYRRHTAGCNRAQATKHERNPKLQKKLKAKDIRLCNCPLWVVGTDSKSKFHRTSLNTCDLAVAAKRIQDTELEKPNAREAMTLHAAYQQYTTILKSQRNVKDNSISNCYDIVFRALERRAQSKGRTMLADVDGPLLDELVAAWKDLGANTRHNYIRILQDIFGVAFRRKWISEDPSVNLERPKRPARKGTLPFDLEHEDPRMIASIPKWMDGIEGVGTSVWTRFPETAAALMYVLRFTGLRISDAILFEPKSLVRRTIKTRIVYCYFLPRQQKTDEPVFCILPTEVAEYILSVPRLTERHAFYNNEGVDENDPKRSMEHKRQWDTRFRQNVLRYLEKVSGVPNIHPHRFRDTFSVDLLAHGTDIRLVSRLLGHTDVATTWKSYEHWLPADRERAAEAMMQTWDSKSNIIPCARERL